MRKKRAFALTAALLFFAVAGVCVAYAWVNAPARVEIAIATERDIKLTLELTGNVERKETHVVSALTAGRVGQILVRPGDAVSTDQMLMRVSSPVLAGAFRQQSSMSDAIERIVQGADDSFGEELAHLSVLLAGSGTSAAAESLNLECVRSPADGVVRELLSSDGGWVTAGTPLAVITGREERVSMPLQDFDTDRIVVGQSVLCTREGAIVGMGTINELSPYKPPAMTVSSLTLTRPPVMIAHVSLPVTGLGDGAQVDCVVDTGERRGVTVPLGALRDDSVLVCENGYAVRRGVRIGHVEAGFAEVRGIPAGARVILSQGAMNGTRIIVTEVRDET